MSVDLRCVLCTEEVVSDGYRSGYIFEHLDAVHALDGHLRYCVYCGADCEADEPEHGDWCPSVTGMYPVTPVSLGMRGPDDPYAHGMGCMDCGCEFKLGDFYAHRFVERQVETFVGPADVGEVVCLGCAALTVPLESA